MTYDWGIPQTQPAPAKKTRRGLIAVLALIVVIIVTAITFLVLPTVLRTPAGLSASQMRGAFQDGQLTDCDLGEDFYRTAGITNLSAGDGGCEGTINDGEKQARVLIVVEETEIIEFLDTTPSDPELTHWKQGRAPIFTQAVAETPEEPDMCTLAATDGPLRGVSIQTDANCEALYPLARNLINAARWFQSQDGFGRFYPFTTPDYLDIPEPVITPALTERDAEEFVFSRGPQHTFWAVGFRDAGYYYCQFNERSGENASPLAFVNCSINGINNVEMVFEPISQRSWEANVVSYEEGVGFGQEFSPGSQGLPSAPALLNPGEQMTLAGTTIALTIDGEIKVTKNGDSFSIINNELSIDNG